ncbi:arylesterase [Rhodohalobacter sp.]|uniref:arylesterase n=1 Tax=Rhodohalobacter sp. TaxID=1974210 RepID=UPI002ACE4326|nr:arylesterase [Rhodohalobacter sp.]MDZ7755236.1 arylesterase [Rhodohalobacter sp.]
MNYKRIGILKVVIFLCGLMLSVDASAQEKQILIFGDSITAGFGLEEENAFPAFIQQKIDSLGMNYNVVNAGLSGETSAGGLRRIDWVLQQNVDVFVLELGGNDGLRGIDPENTKQNLQGIIDKVEEKYPDAEIILTGMEAPPNMGEQYTSRFRSVFFELAEENDVIFMPFVLEGVAGDPELNQGDGIHPTEEGHRVIAENLWEYLEGVL